MAEVVLYYAGHSLACAVGEHGLFAGSSWCQSEGLLHVLQGKKMRDLSPETCSDNSVPLLPKVGVAFTQGVSRRWKDELVSCSRVKDFLVKTGE